MMTVITALFGDLIPYILAAAAALAGLWGFGKVNRRKGAAEAEAKRKAQDAQAHTETVERVLNEKPSDDTADDIRRRLRDRADR